MSNSYKSIKNGRKNSKFYEFSDGTKAVSSYDTLIGIYHNGVLYELEHSSYSCTTSRHYTDFLCKYDIHRYRVPTVVNYPPKTVTQFHPFGTKIGYLNNLQSDLYDLTKNLVKYPELTDPAESTEQREVA